MKGLVCVSILLILILASASCVGPRSTIVSGKVVPKNNVRAGLNYCFNISTSPVYPVAPLKYPNENFSSQDTVYFGKSLMDFNRFIVAYSLDPITFNSEFYMRAGLGHNVDAGYRYSGGHAFDAMFQFLGSNGDVTNSKEGGMYGSIGFQHSWQNYNIIYNNPAIKEFQNAFGFNFSKKDFTIPLVFSRSFGPEEYFGCFSFGMTYTHSFVNYEISPKGVYYLQSSQAGSRPVLLESIKAKANYGSFGTFVNGKFGYRYIFFIAGLNMYYQNYGNYPLLGGATASFLGFTFAPSFGFQFNTSVKRTKKPADI